MTLASKTFLPNLDELKVGLLPQNLGFYKDLFDCEFELLMKSEGCVALWTPPFSVDRQPI
jgi:hypothetical protein